MHQDIIRVIRLVEYIGPRDLVEACLDRSIIGEKIVSTNGRREYRIRAATLGNVAEILGSVEISPRELLDELSDAERESLFEEYCVHCGSTDPLCACKADE